MSTPASVAQRAQLTQEVRKRFLADAGRALTELASAIDERLTALMNEAAPSREMQNRRDAWTFYQTRRATWVDGTFAMWQGTIKPLAASLPKLSLPDGFELVGTEVTENKILASRLVLGVMDKVSTELNDLLLRLKFLEGTQGDDLRDILRPEVLLLMLVEQWAKAGMPRDAWLMVNDVALRLLATQLQQAYISANALLIRQGVLPIIELKDRVKRFSPASGPTPLDKKTPPTPSPAPSTPPAGAGALPGESGVATLHGSSSMGRSGTGYGSAADETRMMSSTTPLARARNRAQGVLGQIKRLLTGSGGASFETTQWQPPSPALAAAIAPLSVPDVSYASDMMGSDTLSGVARAVGQLRHRTAELKNKAQTPSEKATIEIVALMFQSILQEDRIPPGIRVWFARLQMPVLRVALSEPDFFGTLNHPARQLIDRMGSCVMGFDASGINGSALEIEIKRIVQVIEQYPETGKRVYQLVYVEFQKFLSQFLTGHASTQKLVSVAQQVEQKETLTIQYTIEMRNMLKDMPVRDEIREFLFKVWAEALALAAVSKGPQHAETLAFKKSATDLVWAASAKPNRSDRARVIQDLPQLLQQLRAGMTLLSLPLAAQESHIKTVSDILADAFLSKTQAIPTQQIQEMAERLAHLEDFVSDEGMADLPLDAQSVEMMLGIDASKIEVVADSGAKPTPAMQAWAHELEVGAWFSLDHNGRMAQVQFVWRSDRKHLNLFASTDGHSYLIQAGRLATYLKAGLLLPQEEESLTVRATRDALVKLTANPERLLS